MNQHTLGDVWLAMQRSDDFVMRMAGYFSEMMNTSGIFLFFWNSLFMMIIPFLVSRFFKKKRDFIYVITFILSFFIMEKMEDYMTTKVHQQCQYYPFTLPKTQTIINKSEVYREEYSKKLGV